MVACRPVLSLEVEYLAVQYGSLVPHRRLPSERLISSAFLGVLDREVALLDVEAVHAGDIIELSVLSTNSKWRQGVWLAVEGELLCGGAAASQLVIWSDTAPPVAKIEVVRSQDGLLRLYNVWSSGRLGTGSFESQAATSGMLKESQPDGSAIYRCQDIGREPRFDAIAFRLLIQRRG